MRRADGRSRPDVKRGGPSHRAVPAGRIGRSYAVEAGRARWCRRRRRRRVATLFWGNRPLAVEEDLPLEPGGSVQLKGFERVTLEPGETRTVVFVLDAEAVAYWAPHADAWVVESGPVRVQVGASSEDIRQVMQVSVRP